jgi:hypothetical protein
MQQNAQNIEKRTNSKQMTGNLQISQVTQISQRLTQKLTYVQKAAQFADANANAKTKTNANANANAKTKTNANANANANADE